MSQPNFCFSQRADCVVRGFARHGRRVAERQRPSMYNDSAGVCNPKGWQMVAGGRSLRRPAVRGRENSGHPERDARTLRPLQGRFGIRDRRAGGITSLTSLNHRLLSGKPSACRTADPKTNPITPLDAASALCLHSGNPQRGASELTSEVTWQEFSLGFFHSSFGGWFSRVLDRIFAQVDLIK